MKNKNSFFWGVSSSVLFVAGTVLMMFSNLLTIGAILLVLGFLTALSVLRRRRRFYFSENFLVISAMLSLIILSYTFFISYSSNVVIISTSFYALNFLIQISNFRKKKVRLVKTIKSNEKSSTIKEAIKDLKKEIKKSETKKSERVYVYTQKSKSFHLPGCISLARTKQENLKKSNSREDLIVKGYKTCKSCNS